MATVTIQITDSLHERLNREVAAGRAKDHSALVQLLIETAIDSEWKRDVEFKIDEALDEIERGETVVHQKGDCGRLGRAYLQEKRAWQAKS